ncbi:MAG: hypothetical protein ACYTGR_13010 [Planctomycetota bacterium]|jgi:hypothetical protein
MADTPVHTCTLDGRTVVWSAGRGHVKLFYRGRLRRNRLPRSLERLERFWSHVPAELVDLEAWDLD